MDAAREAAKRVMLAFCGGDPLIRGSPHSVGVLVRAGWAKKLAKPFVASNGIRYTHEVTPLGQAEWEKPG